MPQHGKNSLSAPLARQYQAMKHRLFLFRLIGSVAFLLLLLVTGWSRGLKVWLLGFGDDFFVIVALYVVCFSLIAFVASLPLDIYEGFFLERRFGLIRQNFQGWFFDLIKKSLISLVISVIFLEGIYFFLSEFSSVWWIWAAGLWFFLSVVLARIFPKVILPLFFKVTPLAQGDARARLMKLFGRYKVRLKDIYVLDFSKKTVKANAMVAGLGNSKQIFLTDTLLESFTPAETETVLAHELGHYLAHDTLKLVGAGLVGAFCSFGAAHLLFVRLLDLFGFSALSDIAGLPLLLLILFAAGLVLLPFQNAFSRMIEKEADRFALSATGSADIFVAMMRKLGEKNLADFEPTRWEEIFFYDHPPIGKRIAMAREFIHRGEGI